MLIVNTRTTVTRQTLPLIGISKAAGLIGIGNLSPHKLEDKADAPPPIENAGDHRMYSMSNITVICIALNRRLKPGPEMQFDANGKG